MMIKSEEVKDLLCLPRVSRRTEEMVRMLLGLFGRFVHFEQIIFYLILTLYVILTYLYDIFYSIPYLQILGPYGSGKSRVSDVLEKLCSNPFSSGDISDAALFRTIAEKKGPTMIVDEADDLGGGTRRGILLRVLKTGYRQNGSVTRCGRGGTIERFPTFGPKIILNEKGIADRALASRCIVVHMERSTRRFEQLSLSDDGEFKEMRERVRLFADDFRDVVSDRYASFPGIDGIIGRDEEVWGAMIIIAALLSALLDTPSIRETVVRFATRMILQQEKTQLIGNIQAQILQSTQAYVEDPPAPPIEIEGLRFYVGESLCKSIRDGWSIPNLKLDAVSRVLNHFSIIKEVRRPHLKMKIKGHQVEVQRSCYALDEDRLLKLSTQYSKGGKNS